MNLQVDIEMVDIEPIPAVVLSQTAERSAFSRIAVDSIQRVRRTVTAARVPTAGPPFVRFLSRERQPSLEIGLPLDGPHIVPTLRTTVLPGGRAASRWHVGTHESLFDTLEELGRWVTDHGEAAGDPWQWYWTEPDAQQLRIQLVWPIR